jgi:hypothetical protein
MDDQVWENAIRTLSTAADRLGVLWRCVGVESQLRAWRATGDSAQGGDAANALDQARGDLEWLSSGELTTLARTIEELLDVLPPAWD